MSQDVVTIAVTGSSDAIKHALPGLVKRFPELAPVQEIELVDLHAKVKLNVPNAGNVRVELALDVNAAG